MSTDSPAGPSPTTPPAAMPQIIVQQQQSAFGRYGKLLLILLGFSVMTIIGLTASYQRYFSPPGGPQEKFHSLNADAQKKIAIISLKGTIMEGDGFVKKQIDRVREDEDVVAVVLRIDSPGGTVTASDYLYHHLCELTKDKKREIPLVVSMGSICASGGYYIAMAVGDEEQTMFAEPSTWTGSIGVVIPRYDLSGLLANWDVKDASIASHKYKLMGSPTRALNDEERAEEQKLFQELVDQSFARFKGIVQSGRPKFREDEAALDAVATGQIFTASQALEMGLVDKIGFLEDAIQRAAELANHDPDDLRCVEYSEPPASLATLLSAKSAPRSALPTDLATLLDLAAPRAYYLCTLLPALLTNSQP